MAPFEVTINGSLVTSREGTTILDAARENGVDVPTLCHSPRLVPIAACRICLVEVAGQTNLASACNTPVTPGMVVATDSPRVLRARGLIVELLMGSHCGSCMMCDTANVCELRAIAADLDTGVPRLRLRKGFYPLEDAGPNILRDLSKCILCRRCVRACDELAGKNLLAIGNRAFDSKVIAGFDEPLDQHACGDCDICLSLCPTGALTRPREIGTAKQGSPLTIRA